MPDLLPVPHESRKIHAGRVFTLQVETLTLPNGNQMQADIIRHPGSVVIVPITETGEIVLVRQYRPAVGRWLWELPAGTLKPGEDVVDAARRECQEEIGRIPSRLDALGAFLPTPGYCDELMNFYAATGLRAPGAADADLRPDEDENIEARAFSRGRIAEMIAAGEIADLKTVAGLALLPGS